MSDPNLSAFIWSAADLLRGDYKQSEYGKVILPFTVLQRLDCVLEATKPAVLSMGRVSTALCLPVADFRLRQHGTGKTFDFLQASVTAAGVRPRA